MLLHDRIKLFPINKDHGYFLITSYFNSQEAKLFTHNKKPLKRSVYHLIMSKKDSKNKRYIAIFNKELRKMKKDGRYKSLIKYR